MRASKPMMTEPLPGLPHLVCEASEVNLGLLATPDRALHVGGGGGGAVEPAVRGVPSDLRRGELSGTAAAAPWRFLGFSCPWQ